MGTSLLRSLAGLGLFASVALVGCGGSEASNPGTTPASTPLPRFAPGTYVVALTVDGQEADLGKTIRCQEILERNGVLVRPDAGVMVQLTLNEGRNLLRVFRRLSVSDFQLLRQSTKPDWSMGELCTEAVREIVAGLSQPAQPAPPPPGGAPPSQYAPQPVPGAGGPTELPPPGSGPPPVAPPPAAPPRATVELAPLPPAGPLQPAAAAMVAAAEQAYRSGDFARAHASYAEAHRQSADVHLLFDLALCYIKLGRNGDGLKYLQLYLDRAPAAPNRPVAEQKIAELRRLLGDDD